MERSAILNFQGIPGRDASYIFLISSLEGLGYMISSQQFIP